MFFVFLTIFFFFLLFFSLPFWLKTNKVVRPDIARVIINELAPLFPGYANMLQGQSIPVPAARPGVHNEAVQDQANPVVPPVPLGLPNADPIPVPAIPNVPAPVPADIPVVVDNALLNIPQRRPRGRPRRVPPAQVNDPQPVQQRRPRRRAAVAAAEANAVQAPRLDGDDDSDDEEAPAQLNAALVNLDDFANDAVGNFVLPPMDIEWMPSSTPKNQKVSAVLTEKLFFKETLLHLCF